MSLLDNATVEHVDLMARRIIPIIGDLAKPLFGLSASRFDELAQTIDVVFHNGALVNFSYP
jgi:thioester reductase-like protein